MQTWNHLMKPARQLTEPAQCLREPAKPARQLTEHAHDLTEPARDSTEPAEPAKPVLAATTEAGVNMESKIASFLRASSELQR